MRTRILEFDMRARDGRDVKSLKATVVSVHAGTEGELAKAPCPCIRVELDGVVGDRHRSFARTTWLGDKQPKGTVRRNERQWSAVSFEELAAISARLELGEPLQAADLGANLCFSGVDALSRLPRGTILKFPSGATLIVEEYNPPCADMGESLGKKYETRSGTPLSAKDFCQAARLTRGIVGVVEIAGDIRPEDTVDIRIQDSGASSSP